MRIKWIGKYDGNNLPVIPVRDTGKVLPPVTTRHSLVIVPILLVMGILVYIKNSVLGDAVIFTRGTLAVGFLIGIVLFPVHEILHALCFPAGSDVFLFYTVQGLGTTCTTPVTRNRFIFINLFPSLILGGIPLLLYLLIPAGYPFLSTVLFAIAFLHIGGSYADYVNVAHLLRIPANSLIQISGENIYWSAAD